MEKISLYDFLGLLLPGVIFLFFCNILNNLYGVSPDLFEAVDWKINAAILLCFALITGAVLYVSNFYLGTKTKWFNRLFKMYKHVADLYLELDLHSLFNETLNLKAKEWYNKSVFYNKPDFYKLTKNDQKEIKLLQDEYYDRMYYELEYFGKNENSKTFQSFYFFFRQTALASVLLLIALLVLHTLSILPFISFIDTSPSISKIILLACLLILILIISVRLARWYRKRMVMKIYWAYFTHLQQTFNK